MRKNWHTRKTSRLAWFALLLLTPFSASPAQTADHDASLASVKNLDARLARIMQRLIVANASLCSQQMPFIGTVLHARNQYAPHLAEWMIQKGRFPSPIAVELVLPGSPAEAAGIKADDGFMAVNGQPTDTQGIASVPNSGARDRAERLLLVQPASAALSLTILRAGENAPRTITVDPVPACRARWEVTFDKSDLGLSDGELVQLSARFLASEDDDAVAVMAAHELAHVALGHRRRLENLGVKYTALSAYGRSGRLVRAAEDEADKFSARLLHNAGFDPRIAVRFWQGPGRKYSGGLLRSPTHASAAQRAKMIEEEIIGLPK